MKKNYKDEELKNNLDVKRVNQSDSELDRRNAPEPLTREELEYYKRARAISKQRRGEKPKAVKPKQYNPNAFKRPQSPKTYRQQSSIRRDQNKEARNRQLNRQGSIKDTTNTKEEAFNAAQAARLEEYRKRKYYEARYADDDSEEEQDKGKKSNSSFLRWLIFLILFVALGFIISILLFT